MKEATKIPNKLDIAWTAGIYEGEGTFVKHHRSCHVGICQKKVWILKKLLNFFGGHITKVKSNYKTKKYEIFLWQIHGLRSRNFVKLIYKFLSPHRQKRIREVLSVCPKP